ncbi:MAG: phosphoribosylformylglycinamidine cyclo-ligase, partial [Firmicutes bacterium]|nr:phosphoribosylformylglycinamidine cyclo-ligase [Bacillota bacterium]
AAGCREAQAALIGGETAEMPGFYREDEYDLAGFALGIVDKGRLVKGEEAEEGDVIIALPSSGIHANGFSLVRKVFAVGERSLDIYYADLASSLGEALLTPTKIYVAPILSLLAQVKVKGLAHITGGGLYENIPRSLPAGLSARIALKRLQVPPIFSILAAEGGIPQRDMFNTFNMGVGMTVIVSPQDVEPALDILREEGAHVLGEVVAGDEGVIIA